MDKKLGLPYAVWSMALNTTRWDLPYGNSVLYVLSGKVWHK